MPMNTMVTGKMWGRWDSYWEANMELIDIIPEFNLYEEFWKIYTNSDIIPPQYISDQSVIERCIIGDGAEIYGKVQLCNRFRRNHRERYRRP